jgi:hypothetical protein
MFNVQKSLNHISRMEDTRHPNQVDLSEGEMGDKQIDKILRPEQVICRPNLVNKFSISHMKIYHILFVTYVQFFLACNRLKVCCFAVKITWN